MNVFTAAVPPPRTVRPFTSRVFGTLEVGPLWDKGRVTSLYRMEADFLGIDGSLFGD
jgi:hypothetical protein